MTDPKHETVDEVVARCHRRIDEALDRMGTVIRASDRFVLERVTKAAFGAFCGAMQRERVNEAHAFQMRAAALLVINNIVWETVCVLYPREQWLDEADALAKQFLDMLNEGPGR